MMSHSLRRLRLPLLVLLGVVALVTTACGPKPVTPLQRKQGASLASEASFALSIRDYARAEGLMVQAVDLCPDSPEYWITLATARRKQDNRAGSRTAFEQALKAARTLSKRMPDNSQAVLQQVYVLAVLGQVDDARSTLEKAHRDRPDDRTIRLFVEGNELDRLLADPGFKELMP